MGDCANCTTLLSEGLDLCVRARKLDAIVRTMAVADKTPDLPRLAERHNAMWPDQPIMSQSGTVPLWLQDQYERDLADWERRARHHLMQGPHHD